jgi:LysM repeat protein
MTPLPVRFLLLSSLVFGTVALAQQNAPVPIPPLPQVPTKAAPAPATVPGTVPGTTPIPPVTLPPAPASNPAPTAAPAQPAAPAAASTYTVQSGDNPWTIAKKHGIKLDDLLKANEIKDPKNLKIGDVLKLPAGVPSKGAPAAKPAAPVVAIPTAAPPAAGGDWDLYTIKKGDNPWKIAKSLKLDHQKIIQLNQGVDFTKLSIGQQIKVPKKP